MAGETNGTGLIFGVGLFFPWSPAGAQRGLQPEAFRGGLDPLIAAIGLPSPQAAAKGFQLRIALGVVDMPGPGSGPNKGPVAEHCALLGRAARTPPQTAPAPVLRPANQICPQGVPLYIANDLIKMPVALDGKRLIATLIQGGTNGTGLIIVPCRRSIPSGGRGEASRAVRGMPAP